jgi:hypothetical protein
MTSRFWIGFALVPIFGASLGIACNLPPNDPPPEENTDAQVHLGTSPGGSSGGGDSGGTGSETSTIAVGCAAGGGVCMVAGDGNICPVVSALSCGSPLDTDAGIVQMVCCVGFNEASTADAFGGGG